MKDTNILFLINKDTKAKWKQIAAENDLSLSALIVTAVNQYIKGLN